MIFLTTSITNNRHRSVDVLREVFLLLHYLTFQIPTQSQLLSSLDWILQQLLQSVEFLGKNYSRNFFLIRKNCSSTPFTIPKFTRKDYIRRLLSQMLNYFGLSLSLVLSNLLCLCKDFGSAYAVSIWEIISQISTQVFSIWMFIFGTDVTIEWSSTNYWTFGPALNLRLNISWIVTVKITRQVTSIFKTRKFHGKTKIY